MSVIASFPCLLSGVIVATEMKAWSSTRSARVRSVLALSAFIGLGAGLVGASASSLAHGIHSQRHVSSRFRAEYQVVSASGSTHLTENANTVAEPGEDYYAYEGESSADWKLSHSRPYTPEAVLGREHLPGVTHIYAAYSGTSSGKWTPQCIHVGQCEPNMTCSGTIKTEGDNSLILERSGANVKVSLAVFAPAGCGPGGEGFSPVLKNSRSLEDFKVGVGKKVILEMHGQGEDRTDGGGMAHASATATVDLKRFK